MAQAQAQTAVPVGVFIASFKADFFSWVNAVGLVLQLLVVSRVMKYLGVGVAPVHPAAGGAGRLRHPGHRPGRCRIVFLTKVAENGLDYSLQSTPRQALYLPTSRAAKYRAKPLIDTFLVRSGDVLASLLVLLGQCAGLHHRHLRPGQRRLHPGLAGGRPPHRRPPRPFDRSDCDPPG